MVEVFLRDSEARGESLVQLPGQRLTQQIKPLGCWTYPGATCRIRRSCDDRDPAPKLLAALDDPLE